MMTESLNFCLIEGFVLIARCPEHQEVWNKVYPAYTSPTTSPGLCMVFHYELGDLLQSWDRAAWAGGGV